ncbi:MAG: hypothetical protein ABEJ93_04215 [Candidatus Nanohalobium sp.]
MRKFAAGFFLILFISTVTAFPVSVTAVDSAASPSNSALFQVNVSNDLNVKSIYRVSTFSPKPSWFYVENGKTLEPGENEVFNVTITPEKYAVEGRYSFTLYIKQEETGEIKRIEDRFSVQRDQEIVIENFQIEKTSLKPGQQIEGTVKIRSQASQTAKDYQIQLKTPWSSEKLESSPILPGGTREMTYNLPTQKNSSPGIYTLNATLMYRKQKIDEIVKTIEIQKTGRINTSKRTENKILITKTVYTAENTGNQVLTYSFNKTVPTYLTPITRYSPQPNQTETKGTTTIYRWNQTLKPGQKTTIKQKTDYWMPAAAILTIILLLTALKKHRKKIKITKKAEKTSQGLKISIEIVNNSEETFNDVKVEDFVPDIAAVSTDFEMATPKTRKTGDGTRLEWSLEKLEPGDQRILQYKIRPKIEVEDNVTLQRAKIKLNDDKTRKSSKVNAEFTP